MLFQHVYYKERERDLVSTFHCLRFDFDIPISGDEVDRATYLKTPALKIDVMPPESTMT